MTSSEKLFYVILHVFLCTIGGECYLASSTLETLTQQCPEYRQCNVTPGVSTLHSNIYTSCCQTGCYCDDIGRNCFGKASCCNVQKTNALEPRCLPTRIQGKPSAKRIGKEHWSMSAAQLGVIMHDSCPKYVNGSRCENPDVSRLDDNIPVTDMRTGTVFKNKFCRLTV